MFKRRGKSIFNRNLKKMERKISDSDINQDIDFEIIKNADYDSDDFEKYHGIDDINFICLTDNIDKTCFIVAKLLMEKYNTNIGIKYINDTIYIATHCIYFSSIKNEHYSYYYPYNELEDNYFIPEIKNKNDVRLLGKKCLIITNKSLIYKIVQK